MPAVITTSWTTAAIAPIAIFHSNRSVMYSVIAARTMTRPISACREICSPHVGPTTCVFTSFGEIPAWAARSSISAVRSSVERSVSEDVRIEIRFPPTSWISAPSRPYGSAARRSRMSSTPTSLRLSNWISVPPVKSIERLICRIARPASARTSTTPDSANQRLRVRTRSKLGASYPRKTRNA